MRFVNILAAALLALAALVPQQAFAQKEVANPNGIWEHRGSGAEFPRFLGAAERGSVTEFNAEGTDASAGYSLQNSDGTLILTIYIYPVMDGYTCRETFDDAKLAIDKYEGAEVVKQEIQPSPTGKAETAAYFARYFIPAGSVKPDYPDLVSDLYLYCPQNSAWLVKYRASWTGSNETFPDVPKLLRQVSWGAKLN